MHMQQKIFRSTRTIHFIFKLLTRIAPLVFLTLMLSGLAHAGSATTFGAPVQVTPDPGKGYEPSMVVDKFGNIFATAHKENWQLVLGPDSNSPTMTRSMS